MAEALYDWLPQVIQSVTPWVSSHIDKGTRWYDELTSQLDKTRVGIICLTRDNLESTWLHFEAGALSKEVKESRSFVCPYLLDIEPTDVQDPLVQFQITRSTREDTLELVKTINRSLEAVPFEPKILEKQFGRLWPELKQKLDRIPAVRTGALTARSERDLLEEILGRVRNINRKIDSYSVNNPIRALELQDRITRDPATTPALTTRALDLLLGKIPISPRYLIEGDLPLSPHLLEAILDRVRKRAESKSESNDSDDNPDEQP